MNRREALRSTADVLIAGGGLSAGFAIGAGVSGCTPAQTAEPIGAELADAIERHRVATEAWKAMRPAHVAAEQAINDAGGDIFADPEFCRMDDALNAACLRTVEFMDDIVAVPIRTLADMRAKAVYLAQIMPGTCEHNGTIAALLASMGAVEGRA